MRQFILPAAILLLAGGAGLAAQDSKQAEVEAIDRLMKEHKPEEALLKAEALLPASLPVFNKADMSKAQASMKDLNTIMVTYGLAGKAALYSGQYEKAKDYFSKAKEVGGINAKNAEELYSPVIENWGKAVTIAKEFLEKEKESIDYIQGKMDKKEALVDNEPAFWQNVETHKKNISNATMVTDKIKGIIDGLKKDATAYDPAIEGVVKDLEGEKKGIEEMKAAMDKNPALGKKYKNDVKKCYVDAVLSKRDAAGEVDNLKNFATLDDKLRLMNRMSVLDPSHAVPKEEKDILLGLKERKAVKQPKGKGKKKTTK